MKVPDKPLANVNVQRLLNPGTCCKENSDKTILNTSLIVPITCCNLVTKRYVSFDWGDSKTRFNNHTPDSAAGPFYAWCSGSMVVACMVSLICTNIFRERRNSDADNNDKTPPLPTMTRSRRQRQQQDAANDKRPKDDDDEDKE